MAQACVLISPAAEHFSFFTECSSYRADADEYLKNEKSPQRRFKNLIDVSISALQWAIQTLRPDRDSIIGEVKEWENQKGEERSFNESRNRSEEKKWYLIDYTTSRRIESSSKMS